MLFCNTNDTLVKLKISITSGISLPDKTCHQNTTKKPKKNLQQYKSRFSVIAEVILAFASSTTLVREAKNKSPAFKDIDRQCFELLNVLIWINRSILLLNSKQFHQIL